MSIGNPNLQPPNSPEKLKDIPLEWYMAKSAENHGVYDVIFSDRFYEKFGQELEKYIGTYSHLITNNVVESALEIENESERERTLEAEKKIMEITGFSAKELMDKKKKLYRLYKGKEDNSEFTETGPVVEVKLA